MGMILRDIWMAALSIVLLGSIAIAGEAGLFSFPVGTASIAPTQESNNKNGYHISQSFNTGVDYVANSPDGGWCSLGLRYTEKVACEVAGGKWYYGHTGVDLSNRASGGEIRAIGDGTVSIISRSTCSTCWGNMVRIEHTLPNGKLIYSQYGHMSSIDPSIMQDRPVTLGQKIGEVGSTGASTAPHLHIEMKIEDTDGPGYLLDDPQNRMRNFFDPLLFIDDRMFGMTIALSPGWTQISAPFHSTSTTTYIEHNGRKYSLGKAATLGPVGPRLIYEYIYQYVNGQWITSNIITGDLLFESGKSYWIYSYVAPSGGMGLFTPGNNYPSARGRQDMVDTAGLDGARRCKKRRRPALAGRSTVAQDQRVSARKCLQ